MLCKKSRGLVGYHGNEINKPLHSNGHLPNISSASPSLRCTVYLDAVCGYPYPTSSFSTNPSSNPSGLMYPTLGHCIHIQHRDTRTLSIKDPAAHGRRRTVVCDEHSHPSRPPDDFHQRRNPSLQQPI
jgi:hypothetical protein